MTIPLTGAGGFFTRFGHLVGRCTDVNALRGGAATARVLSGANMASTVLGTVVPDYAAGTAIPQVVGPIGGDLASFQGSGSSFCQALQRYAQLTLQAMYGIDVLGLSNQSQVSAFQQLQLLPAVQALISQMVNNTESVQEATVSIGAQTAVGTPVGNPIIVGSLVNGLGYTLQLPFPETLTFKCSQDHQGGATSGNEAFAVTGQPAVADLLSYLYPAGSGVSVSLSAVDGSKDVTTGNLLVNSDFVTASTANYPDNWIIGVGAAGTTVFQTTSGAYTTGGGALQFTGDGGGTLIAVSQKFNTARSTNAGLGGNTSRLVQNMVYHYNFWAKVSATPTTGVLEVALVDGSGTVIQNDQGVDNLHTHDLTAVSTSYVPFNGGFQMPSLLPSAAYLRVRLSTAIDSGKSVYMGRMSFALASNSGGNGIYPGGPYFTIHSGKTAVLDGLTADTWTMAVSNNYSTSAHGLMHQWMDRVFGLRTLAAPALQLPYNASPTVADTLIA